MRYSPVMRLATHLMLLLSLFAVVGCGEVKSSGDGGVGGPDAAADTRPNGSACTDDVQCLNGQCADGYCCNSACEGQCEACDLEGSIGTCAPVTGTPHGTRSACTGTDTVCAGACDGVERTACVYPTVECRGQTCTGTTKTAPASCSMGVCPEPTTETCGVTCGGSDCLTVIDVAAGYFNTCAVMSNGTARCWGNNLGGQNGYPGSETSLVPKEVPGLTNVKQITTAFAHTCALLEDGTARCWGYNETGELGRGTTGTTESPVPMPVLNEQGNAPLPGIQSISAGWLRTCAVILLPGSRREARCWGNNTKGAIGNGSTAAGFHALPQPVCLSGSVAGGNCSALTGVDQIAVSFEHVCARSSTRLACWGSNTRGQLGFAADTVAHPNPLFVKTEPGGATELRVDMVAGGQRGSETTCAIRSSDKAVVCWGGRNFAGQLGRGSFTDPLPGRETPTPVCGAASGCPSLTGAAVAVSSSHSCSITVDKARCWGAGGLGRLGDGSDTDKAVSASDVATAANVRKIATGESHNCAILLDGRLQCWGNREAIGRADGDHALLPIFPEW